MYIASGSGLRVVFVTSDKADLYFLEGPCCVRPLECSDLRAGNAMSDKRLRVGIFVSVGSFLMIADSFSLLVKFRGEVFSVLTGGYI